MTFEEFVRSTKVTLRFHSFQHLADTYCSIKFLVIVYINAVDADKYNSKLFVNRSQVALTGLTASRKSHTRKRSKLRRRGLTKQA